MSEPPLQKRLIVMASQIGSRLFRQNSGMGWIGKSTRFTKEMKVIVHPGDVIIRKARPFHAGFEGLADLGGWHSKTITQDMVGKKVAIYAALETKSDIGTASPEQLNFIVQVQKSGGIAGIVKTEEEGWELLSQ